MKKNLRRFVDNRPDETPAQEHDGTTNFLGQNGKLGLTTWIAVTVFIGIGVTARADGLSVIHLVNTATGQGLSRDGKSYFIKGGGAMGRKTHWRPPGGNSARTWGLEHADAILDEAQKNGLTVTLGIWLGHPRHGFDDTNADQVSKQLDDARKAILKYKDHPALLMWGLGNEMGENGDNILSI